MEREDVDPAPELHRHGLLVAGRGGAVVVGLLEDLQRTAGRLAGPDDHVDVDCLAFLDVGGIDTFSTRTSRS